MQFSLISRQLATEAGYISILLIFINLSIPFSLAYNSTTFSDNNVNLPTGSLVHSSIDFSTFNERDDSKTKPTSELAISQVRQIDLRDNTRSKFDESKRSDRKADDPLSTDCFAKRREISTKQQQSGNNQRSPDIHISSGYQRLRPKHGLTNLTHGTSSSFDNEHVPQCHQNGGYEPIQCHKIGYCWCVNKYGQAIKNSATLAGERPYCDISLYESESNDLLVVTGVSAQRIKNLLKSSGVPNPDSSSTNNQSNMETDPDSSLDQDGRNQSKDQETNFSRRVSTSLEPSLALVPNECTLSRQNAMERATKHTDDSIWIPECDMNNEKLYGEKQCHKSKVCWCVDQNTGLPLRTSEQLTKQTSINCTEIKRIIDTASTMIKSNMPKQQSSFFQGFSESCDADKRIEFVLFLINQFRRQLSEFVKLDPTSLPPPGFPSSNPYALSESQVSLWKFVTMDQDLDGKLDDREWSRFKVNFKLIDKSVDINRPYKQELYTHSTMTPLNIIRSQRRCWRDFLQFCSNGDILTNESITRAKWLSCTETPSRSNQFSPDKPIQQSSEHIPDAYTKAAAVARSKKKNPFLGILKPD